MLNSLNFFSSALKVSENHVIFHFVQYLLYKVICLSFYCLEIHLCDVRSSKWTKAQPVDNRLCHQHKSQTRTTEPE